MTLENPYLDIIEYYKGIKEKTENKIRNLRLNLLEIISETFDKLLFLRIRLNFRFRFFDYIDKDIQIPEHRNLLHYKKSYVKSIIKSLIKELNSEAEYLEWARANLIKYTKLSEQFISLQCINDDNEIEQIMIRIDKDYFSIKAHCYPS